jgi:hypothetical protein
VEGLEAIDVELLCLCDDFRRPVALMSAEMQSPVYGKTYAGRGDSGFVPYLTTRRRIKLA